MCYGLYNPETSLWGDTRMIKMYFHVVHGGDRRRYGGARRNSPSSISPHPTTDAEEEENETV